MSHPVYVDEPFVWPASTGQTHRVGVRHGHRWCHMWSDDLEALHNLARKIGLRPAWFQDKPGFPHYDLIPTKRSLALLYGAQEKSLREYLIERKQNCVSPEKHTQ